MNTLAVIPTFLRKPEELAIHMKCLETLRATAPDVEILVVDDGSPAPELVEEMRGAITRLHFAVYSQENGGFSRAVNVGLRQALERGQDAVLINSDIEFLDSGWLDVMLRQTVNDSEDLASVVGARLLYPNGLVAHNGIFFSLLHRVFGHIHQYAPHDLPEAQHARTCPVTGALQLIRHEALVAVGIYDEGFSMGHEDVDFCLRVFMSGRSCVVQPKVRAIHYESMFRGDPTPQIERWHAESWEYFLKKHANTPLATYVPSLT